jgi:hypothetical protein
MRIGPQRLEAAQSLSSRIWVDQRAPAAADERLPRSFRLGESVGDGVDRGGVMAEPAMATFSPQDEAASRQTGLGGLNRKPTRYRGQDIAAGLRSPRSGGGRSGPARLDEAVVAYEKH